VRSVNRAAAAFREHKVSSAALYKESLTYRAGSCEVLCGDSRKLRSIKDESVDIVLTDPPYLDYIAYSELGHFFTSWLAKFKLVDARHVERFPVGQLAALSRSNQDSEKFAKELTKVFHELSRVLKTDGRLVFTYQNLDGQGWTAIGHALAQSGFKPVSVFPLYGENASRLHKRTQSISWDCVMVCIPTASPISWKLKEIDVEKGLKFSQQWAEKIESAGLPFGDGDQKNLVHAGTIFSALERMSGGRRLTPLINRVQ
jgi:adenine-specific DNA methylase